MERSDQAGKLFAEDTLPYPNSEDGEPPTREAARTAPGPESGPGTPTDDMLAVEYREDEIQRGALPLEHTPAPEDLYEPGGGNLSPGADIEDESPPDRGGRTY